MTSVNQLGDLKSLKMADLDSSVTVEDLHLLLALSFPFSSVRPFSFVSYTKMHVPCLEDGPYFVAVPLSSWLGSVFNL